MLNFCRKQITIDHWSYRNIISLFCYICKMKTFESIRNHFESIGLTATQIYQKYRFNVKNVTVLLILGVNILLTGAYITCMATNFEEYVDSLYGLSTVLLIFIVFIHLIWRMEEIFRFIVKFKNTINKREWIYFSVYVFLPVDNHQYFKHFDFKFTRFRISQDSWIRHRKWFTIKSIKHYKNGLNF